MFPTIFFFDWTWFLLVPAFVVAIYAQIRVKSTFARYSREMARSGTTGREAARRLLDRAGLSFVEIKPVPGELTDHYDPRARVLRLSSSVYGSRSLAALGVAAHEAGHAMQHGQNYAPLVFRNAIYPVVAFGQHLWYLIIMFGLFMMYSAQGIPLWIIDLGIMVMSGVVMFQVVTLPVEFNASRRALAQLVNGGIIEPDELKSTRAVLNAAAFTYVAGTLMAMLQLLRLILMRRSRN